MPITGPARLSMGRGTVSRSAHRLPPDLAGRLVLAQSDKDSVAEQRLVGPTEIGDLGDEFGSHPMHLGQGQRAAKPAPPRRRRG